MNDDSTPLLRSGVGRAIITPAVGFLISGPEFSDRPSTGIDDDLLVRTLVVESYGTRAALISIDIWGIDSILERRIYETVSHDTGIPEDHLVLACTGNGTSPPLWRGADIPNQYLNYVNYLPDIVAGAALSAQTNLQPAAAGSTSASLPNLNCYSVGRPSSNVENELHHLPLLAITDAVDNVLNLTAGFACPAVIRGEAGRWTADYPGFACWAMEQSGVDLALFIQSTSSNVRPFDWYLDNPNPSHTNRDATDVQALGVLLATQAAQTIGNIQTRRNAVVRCGVDESSGIRSLRIGDAIFIVAPKSQPIEFATTIGASLPGVTLFVSAINREPEEAEKAQLEREYFVAAIRQAKQALD